MPLLRIIFPIKGILTRACRNRFSNVLSLALPCLDCSLPAMIFSSQPSAVPCQCPRHPTPPPKDRQTVFGKISVLPSWFLLITHTTNAITSFPKDLFCYRCRFLFGSRKSPFHRPVSRSRNNYFANRQGFKGPGFVFLLILVVLARGQREEQTQSRSARPFFNPKQTPRGHVACSYQKS